MTIFIILFIYLLLLKVLFEGKNSDKDRKKLCVFAGFGLWIVLALRSPYCGVDLVSGDYAAANYLTLFFRAADYSFIQIIKGVLSYFSSAEVGWLVYCKLVSLISKDFQFFLAITAFIQIFLIGFVFYKYSSDIILSYIVYFCFGLYIMSFSGLRQSTATALTFFSFYFLVNNKKWLFALIVLLASSLHTSALLFVIAYPLKKIRLNTRKSIVSIIGIFAALPFLSFVVSAVIPILFGSRYRHYMDSGGAITLFLLYVIIFLFSLKTKLVTQQDSLYRNLIVVAVACQSLGYISAGAMTRIGFYFSIFFTLLFPELIKVYSDKGSRQTLFIIVSLLFFAFFYITNIDGYLNVIPYYFYWERIFIY